MTLNLPSLYFWLEEYGQTRPKKNQSPNLWHVTSILVCCIFAATRKNSRGFSLCNFLRIGECCSCPQLLDELADIATEWGRGLRGPRGTRPITNPVGRGGIGDTDAADDSEDSFRLKSWPKRTSRAEITVYNVCSTEKRTKRSSNILLCLVRFSAGQTLPSYFFRRALQLISLFSFLLHENISIGFRTAMHTDWRIKGLKISGKSKC